MRHPLWAINSALLILLACALAFIFYARKKTLKRTSIRPLEYVPSTVKRAAHINIEKIYTNDLFETYTPSFVPVEVPNYVTPLPAPPEPRPIQIPEVPTIEFLEPLSISLKGVISFAEDDTKNRAIIADEETKQETILKVGDSIEDAQLVRIFTKKIVLVRSNGQQEIVYLREQDAKHDPSLRTKKDWEKIINRKDESTYEIIANDFVEWVNSLSQLIDLLDLTTVYRSGKSAGVRIGDTASDSLGAALGFSDGDVILTINGTPATSTDNKLKIFKSIVTDRLTDEIIVELLKNGQEQKLVYKIIDQAPRKKQKTINNQEKFLSPPRFEQENIDILQEKHKFAPTMQELKKQEKKSMFQNGSLLQNIKPSITE